MVNSKSLSTKDAAQKWILIGIPILFIVGSLFHFIYEWSGNSIIVGIFSPINESVWEHLKMTFWPMLIWWFIGYCMFNKTTGFSTVKWFVSCALAELICILVILSFYYTYTRALGIESLILDIFSLFLGILVSQLFALHFYNFANINDNWGYIAIAILILLALTFTFFTFAPPNIPLFNDSKT